METEEKDMSQDTPKTGGKLKKFKISFPSSKDIKENMYYKVGSISGILLILGSLLPWAKVENLDYKVSIGIALYGRGLGIIIFILGLLLLFGGLVKTPFGIPQKLYFSVIGLTSFFIVLLYIFDASSVENVSSGVWIALSGAVLLVLQTIYNLLTDKNFKLDTNQSISKCGLYNIGGLALLGGIAAFFFSYNSETVKLGFGSIKKQPIQNFYNEPILFSDNLKLLSIFSIILLGCLFISCILHKTSLKAPSSLFLLFSVPIFFMNSTFIFNIFSTNSPFENIGGGAGNWVLFICSGAISVIAYREIRSNTT